MEVHLDRALVTGAFPLDQHRTLRHPKEELLYHPDELNKIVLLAGAADGRATVRHGIAAGQTQEDR